jgi:hypothetical protein
MLTSIRELFLLIRYRGPILNQSFDIPLFSFTGISVGLLAAITGAESGFALRRNAE